jgi:Radical SAM superfamily
LRNILLVEPAYKNKYPPIGLMKISTYHKRRGDNVHFVKGQSKEAVAKIWDRIYITTLFTFHFDLTVSTIRFYKRAVHSVDDIYVGGILASLLPDQLEKATGVRKIITGQLDDSSKIGYNDGKDIDNLPLDYDILDDIDYIYPAGDNYFAYTTRGCPNKCPFCAVPKLEPKFKTTNNVYNQIKQINSRFGIKRNLLLLDNNVLYSPKLESIVADIKKAGFVKEANFVEPSPLPTFLRRIQGGYNVDKNYQRAVRYLTEFRGRIKDETVIKAYDTLMEEFTISRTPMRALSSRADKFLTLIDKFKNNVKKQRYVDFNQGIDARLLTENRIKILSEIPIDPLRIAFDNISQAKIYEKAIRLAYRYGFRSFSNYMLYNHKDRPEDLWRRLMINADLKEDLGLNLFSFPMKYIPVEDTNREFVSDHWTKKYIRAIQSILLVKRGIVSTSRSFFEKAFGRTLDEYFEILMMPEDFIIYRKYFEEEKGLTIEWQELYRALSENDKSLLLQAVKTNKVVPLAGVHYSQRLKKVFQYYEITYPEDNTSKVSQLSADSGDGERLFRRDGEHLNRLRKN